MPRKIDHAARYAIAKRLRAGVRPQVLAREYGVTVRTIYRCDQVIREVREERGVREAVVVCRVSKAELEAFDAKLRAAGVGNRSEALRNLIRATGGIAVPDAELARALHEARASLNRVGNNVSQIAKRMNDAKNRGQHQSIDEDDLRSIRHLAGYVLGLADDLALMKEGRDTDLRQEVSAELARLAERGV